MRLTTVVPSRLRLFFHADVVSSANLVPVNGDESETIDTSDRYMVITFRI